MKAVPCVTCGKKAPSAGHPLMVCGDWLERPRQVSQMEVATNKQIEVAIDKHRELIVQVKRGPKLKLEGWELLGSTAQWNRIRHAVYQRDQQTCQQCGRKCDDTHQGQKVCHHLFGKDLIISTDLTHYITLCMRCHGQLPAIRQDLHIDGEVIARVEKP